MGLLLVYVLTAKAAAISYGNESESRQSHSWFTTQRTDTREIAALLEVPLSILTRYISRNTRITNAVLRVFAAPADRYAYNVYFDDEYAVMGVFGYVGNGIAEASDFEAGVFLDSKKIRGRTHGSWYDFNVTPFVNGIFSNNNEFAGFTLRSLSQHQILLPSAGGIFEIYPPTLILSGGVEPEPVPEPTTIFGSAIGLCLGGWLKRKKSTLQNKTMSQG